MGSLVSADPAGSTGRSPTRVDPTTDANALDGLAAGRLIRFGDFVGAVAVRQHRLSYNRITPKLQRDETGRPVPYRPGRLELRGLDVYRLLSPYVGTRFLAQFRVVVPLALYLVLFQFLILRQAVSTPASIAAGLVAVVLGLMLFMEGLKLGLMPFGETIGSRLPKRSPLLVVLLIAFLLGVGVTFAEPAIGALKIAGATVSPDGAPYLHALLNGWTDALVLIVGIGVGLAAVVGTLRFLYGWSLKPLIFATVLPTLALTLYAAIDDGMASVIGLAWDCGAVTTGPVTVPLVLALGIGVASAAGKGSASLSGFGIVTLASLFPVLGVLCLALYVSWTVPIESLGAATAASAGTASGPGWFDRTPGLEIAAGLQAIVPLMIFLVLVLKLIVRERITQAGIIVYGVTLAVLGMIIFNLGLSYGLAALGDQSGALVPAAFATIGAVPGSPLYGVAIGIGIAIAFAWCLGLGATLAEPALNALGLTVENLTNGAFRKSLLMYAVAVGVACGIALGIVKLIYGFPLPWLLVPGYAVALLLTMLSSESFVNIAWDSAGVTTGPVTVPLVLAMGLGFGGAVDATEGFGILSMASICPILSVMAMGLWIDRRGKHG